MIIAEVIYLPDSIHVDFNLDFGSLDGKGSGKSTKVNFRFRCDPPELFPQSHLLSG